MMAQICKKCIHKKMDTPELKIECKCINVTVIDLKEEFKQWRKN